MERENIKNIETRPETIDVPTRSEYISHKSKAKSDPDPPSSDPSDDSSSLSDSTRRRRRIKKKGIRKRRRRKKYESDPSSSDDSDDSDSSDDSHFRGRRHVHTKNWKEDPIQLCANLTAKLLTTTFKSKMIRFKLDEDPLQRRIYFLTFIDSLNRM